jgi:hypothetical protein
MKITKRDIKNLEQKETYSSRIIKSLEVNSFSGFLHFKINHPTISYDIANLIKKRKKHFLAARSDARCGARGLLRGASLRQGLLQDVY